MFILPVGIINYMVFISNICFIYTDPGAANFNRHISIEISARLYFSVLFNLINSQALQRSTHDQLPEACGTLCTDSLLQLTLLAVLNL